ncbi:hypothetical protein [Streptomyces sp. NPDC058572]|uniref:hypothetical protein n=1 Tax=Streptomyces sp. NPDC058572 TaxID=3346546 RepID=UPI00365D3982
MHAFGSPDRLAGVAGEVQHRAAPYSDIGAAFAPSLAEALTDHHGDGYVLLDGIVAETDRVHTEGHYSGKARREGVNLQVITADEGTLLWISPALPGGTHDVKACALRQRTAGPVRPGPAPGADARGGA